MARGETEPDNQADREIEMTHLESAIKQAKLMESLQDSANRNGWEKTEGGFDAYQEANEIHDTNFRKLSKEERREYFRQVN